MDVWGRGSAAIKRDMTAISKNRGGGGEVKRPRKRRAGRYKALWQKLLFGGEEKVAVLCRGRVMRSQANAGAKS